MTHPVTGRLQIVGSGAIGSLVAAGAQANHIPFSLAPRHARPATQRLLGYGGAATLLGSNLPVADKLTAQDVLVLPLKAHQLADAALAWKDKLHPDTAVLLLHNGMGGLEAVRAVLPEHPLYLATTSHGALRLNATEVKHTGFGRTMLGEAPDNKGTDPIQKERLLEMLSQCLAPVTWHQDIMEALWLKLAVNAVINPLTALHDIRNGELNNSQFNGHICDICQEVSQVMAQAGYQHSAAVLKEQVKKVARQTAQNYSSMHQDVANGRPTEIDAINGFIIQQAQKKGIDVSINTFLYNKIKALETRYAG